MSSIVERIFQQRQAFKESQPSNQNTPPIQVEPRQETVARLEELIKKLKA